MTRKAQPSPVDDALVLRRFLYVAFCPTCGAIQGADATRAEALGWSNATCPPSHGNKVAVAKYELAAKGERR